MTKPSKRFLLVDDDPQNNAISKMALRKSLGEVEVMEFIFPLMALEYISTELFLSTPDEKTTLFLDINMPVLSGWEFLEKFETLQEPTKNMINIYMLSSSVDPTDILRAKLNPHVIDFIEKPLNKVVISKLFG